MLAKTIETKIDEFYDPYLAKQWQTANVGKKVTVETGQIKVTVILPYPCEDIRADLLTHLNNWLMPVSEGRSIDISLNWKVEGHIGKQGIAALPGIKNIVAVASGKGGVGKSTVAVNMALALSKAGARVGLLDADIYGPSQPTMLGSEGVKPEIVDKQFMPVVRHGIQTMSIGYLVEETSALVWRGPMIGKAMQQLIHDTNWQQLDYLIIDLPPGTGDIQLTLCQKVPVSGAVIVTTPQDLALADVRRACEMFNKLNVPILGVIENMSTYHCPHCGHNAEIFGAGGGEKIEQEYNTQLLAKIPLNLSIRQMTDSGNPPVVQANSDAEIFMSAARKMAANLSLQPKDYSSKFPKIVVE